MKGSRTPRACRLNQIRRGMIPSQLVLSPEFLVFSQYSQERQSSCVKLQMENARGCISRCAANSPRPSMKNSPFVSATPIVVIGIPSNTLSEAPRAKLQKIPSIIRPCTKQANRRRFLESRRRQEKNLNESSRLKSDIGITTVLNYSDIVMLTPCRIDLQLISPPPPSRFHVIASNALQLAIIPA